MTSIQVSIALPGRLTPERVSELVTMATSRLRWELCNRLVEQKRETRQRASAIRARNKVEARWRAGAMDDDAIRRYLTVDPSATNREVSVALGVRDGSTVTAIRDELNRARESC